MELFKLENDKVGTVDIDKMFNRENVDKAFSLFEEGIKKEELDCDITEDWMFMWEDEKKYSFKHRMTKNCISVSKYTGEIKIKDNWLYNGAGTAHMDNQVRAWFDKKEE